jgi:Tetracyclin repressor-like, C-terminal domain
MLNSTAMLNSPAGCALQCLMSETERDESFARLLHERVKEPRKRMFLDLLARGAARGQVRPAAATQLVAEVGPALGCSGSSPTAPRCPTTTSCR